MAEDRKVFPVETVLELVTGKKGADVEAIASFILGKTVDCETCAQAAGPFAAAWLARWYPKFADLQYKEGDNWHEFVTRAKSLLGDNVSLPPMTGCLRDMAQQVLQTIADTQASLARQTEAAMGLEKKVRELEPHRQNAIVAQKKCDELENKMKAMKSDMNAMARTAAEFQGKLAINHDELMDNIREAIKDGMRGFAIGAATEAMGAQGAAQAVSAAEQEEKEAPSDFGFGSSGADSDGFGF